MVNLIPFHEVFYRVKIILLLPRMCFTTQGRTLWQRGVKRFLFKLRVVIANAVAGKTSSITTTCRSLMLRLSVGAPSRRERMVLIL